MRDLLCSASCLSGSVHVAPLLRRRSGGDASTGEKGERPRRRQAIPELGGTEEGDGEEPGSESGGSEGAGEAGSG
eukprot:CAMPEP_0185393408 /NCGR_PEP_ID=MMETSP1364-20130426/78509_1 /TAXON_ID=38817 /ORGANISM="Gephyrocapsa oceanica, Strain RCC1303" /LENGTH=74 /DNA_ID=CAMNT_0027995491 /DNA_START=57 /DNA_END=278 /DNA_ORIENTATION=-